MSSMPPVIDSKFITGEELLEMGDIGHCELVEGKILPLAYADVKQGHLVTKVACTLEDFVEPRNLGWVMTGEVGVFYQTRTG